jgi:hypothetical protein
MQVKTKFGLFLVALGIGIFAAWTLWTKTRDFIPVNVPVSLLAGQSVTENFRLNFDGLYLIEIEAEKTAIPLNILHCLMEVEADHAECRYIPPAIEAAWAISSNGHEIAHGSSLQLHSVPAQSNTVVRVIGEFQGKAGQSYQLRLTSTIDGQSLAKANPRLKVGVASIAYTDIQSASVLVFSTTFICLLFGVVLLSISYFAKRRSDQGGASVAA